MPPDYPVAAIIVLSEEMYWMESDGSNPKLRKALRCLTPPSTLPFDFDR